MKKKTIKNSVSISGKGLHTGVRTTITLQPAEEGYGIKFRRVDIKEKPEIPADINYVYDTKRSTKLKKGDITISTIEHILSALMAQGVDNVMIDIDGPEVPIMDGSAAPFYQAIEEAGTVEQDEEKEYFCVSEPITYNDEAGSEYIIMPADTFEVKAMIDFNSEVLGKQYAEIKSLNQFKEDLAPCKTFVFVKDILPLLEQDLIKGGDLENALVIAEDYLTDDHLKLISDKVQIPEKEFSREGVINAGNMTFKNEPARHKLMDFIGDLALLGRPVLGKILISRPGHTSNIEFTKLLRQEFVRQRKLKGKPAYDPNKEALYTVEDIKKLLPHRYPFLLVDKIIELTETTVVGIKNITFNEGFFQGHFPDNPVFPGVLQMEALAQTGGILALTQVDEDTAWDTYFLKMDNVKFKGKVVPGDTIILKMELLEPIRRGIVHMQGTAYVGDKIVSEGELTAQIVKRD